LITIIVLIIFIVGCIGWDSEIVGLRVHAERIENLGRHYAQDEQEGKERRGTTDRKWRKFVNVVFLFFFIFTSLLIYIVICGRT
jgi:hypothetical protein